MTFQDTGLKEAFFGHIPYPESEIKKAWKEYLFVFDTNVLLNFYRYSESTQASWKSVFETIASRLWIPHRVGQEYFENRVSTIVDGVDEYDSALKTLNNLPKQFSGDRHPHLPDDLKDELETLIIRINHHFEERKQNISEQIKDDPIQDFFITCYESKVGRPYSNEDMKKIIEEGKRRYIEKIPPGYCDASKGKEDSLNSNLKPYGDLIIWKQMIEKSKISGKGIIFVTDDSKEDWWKLNGSQKLCARPELIEEFYEESKSKIFIYSPSSFLKFSKDHLHTKVDEASMEETKNLKTDIIQEQARIIDHIIPSGKSTLNNIFADKNSYIIDHFSNKLLSAEPYQDYIEKIRRERITEQLLQNSARRRDICSQLEVEENANMKVYLSEMLTKLLVEYEQLSRELYSLLDK